MNKEELLKGLTEEQIAKIKSFKNQEDLLKFAKDQGIELTDEQLEAVNGGCGTTTGYWGCPYCGYRWGAMSLGNGRARCFGCDGEFNDRDVKYYKINKNK